MVRDILSPARSQNQRRSGCLQRPFCTAAFAQLRSSAPGPVAASGDQGHWCRPLPSLPSAFGNMRGGFWQHEGRAAPVPSAGREAQRLCEASGVSAGTCFVPQTCPTCPCPGVPAPYSAFRAPQQPKRVGRGCSRPCPCPGCPSGLHLLRPPPAAEQLRGGASPQESLGF